MMLLRVGFKCPPEARGIRVLGLQQVANLGDCEIFERWGATGQSGLLGGGPSRF